MALYTLIQYSTLALMADVCDPDASNSPFKSTHLFVNIIPQGLVYFLFNHSVDPPSF
ncbi:hypothetical protein BDV36DRAFT_246682 [Aspergillus pseudocaelatus]|uniref:Uncharacterized protein n=1 Tax=Aspergillus pseudocaelatus TaxID=1825620 RepID=A0ABQ6WXH2_9EURO|nr:hypothetical protein BDV36DRAFT_246682 [Aspergillus pseudocaelatus]